MVATPGERIRFLRNSLNLSQTEFAARIGMTRSMISNLELNLVSAPDYSIKLIAGEYHVSAEWIKTGIGDMYAASPAPDTFDAIIQRSGSSDAVKTFINIYSQLTPQNQKALTAVLDQVSALMAQGKSSNPDDLLEQAKGAVIQSEENKKAGNE